MNKTEDDELGSEDLSDEELRSITGRCALSPSVLGSVNCCLEFELN